MWRSYVYALAGVVLGGVVALWVERENLSLAKTYNQEAIRIAVESAEINAESQELNEKSSELLDRAVRVCFGDLMEI